MFPLNETGYTLRSRLFYQENRKMTSLPAFELIQLHVSYGFHRVSYHASWACF